MAFLGIVATCCNYSWNNRSACRSYLGIRFDASWCDTHCYADWDDNRRAAHHSRFSLGSKEFILREDILIELPGDRLRDSLHTH